MKIIFLGTNGWYSTQTGNTACVLIDSKDAYIVLDAGEGIYKLDRYIKDEKKPIYIFISHFHLDHIHGFHVLDKFHFKQPVHIFGKRGTCELLKLFISQPFTNGLENLPYKVEITDLEEGAYESPLRFDCALLPHSDPSMGYRFNIDGKIITYCTDTGRSDKALRLANEADVFISECSLRPGEPTDKGWPHLNPEDAAAEAKDANAGRLVLTHFDAARYANIEERKEAERAARNIFPNTTAATDGVELEL
jgi:ribonuclease BN (tRNA processing enzyme)